ncbi:MAG: hypothetical protein WDM78_01495 [Puia sp.]
MSTGSQKIINDPVYGFITIDHPLILEVIRSPFYQRLRRIQQMGFANLVYPGCSAYPSPPFSGSLSSDVQCTFRAQRKRHRNYRGRRTGCKNGHSFT